jgi:PKHD-type hydroxylase
MNQWWQMWKGYLTQLECDSLVSQGMRLPEQDGVVGHGGQSRSDGSLRRSKVRWVHPTDQAFALTFHKLSSLFHQANNAAFGFDLNYLRSMQFTEYAAEYDGHYDWHEDLTWDKPGASHRKLSMVVQLSGADSYVGGDLVLAKEPPEKQDLRVQGTVIVFPSFCSHKVEPLLSGVRYSLVAWYEGPKFR